MWCELKAISQSVSTRPHQILQSEIKDAGKYPVISQSNMFIEGYSNQEEKIMQSLPVIIFGDHTRNVKFIDFKFIVGADGVKILKPVNIFPKYLYYLILHASKTIENRGYSRHFRLLKEITYPLPPPAEQQKIVQKIDILYRFLEEIEESLH